MQSTHTEVQRTQRHRQSFPTVGHSDGLAHTPPGSPPQIVFKALIVLHTMIRNGATDNVLSHLSQSDILRLRNVTNGQWEGEATLPSLIFSGLLTPRPCRKVTRHRRTWPTTRCTWTTGYERTEISNMTPSASNPRPTATTESVEWVTKNMVSWALGWPRP